MQGLQLSSSVYNLPDCTQNKWKVINNIDFFYTCAMRALRQLGRSASASLLLGGRRFSEDAGGEEDDEEHHNASQQTPLDKTLTKIGFGTYQKKLLWVKMLYFPVVYLLLMLLIPSCSLHS